MSEYNSKTTKADLIKIIEDKESLIKLALHHEEGRKVYVTEMHATINALHEDVMVEQNKNRDMIQVHIDNLPGSKMEITRLKDEVKFLKADLKTQKHWNNSAELDSLNKEIDRLKNKIVSLI